MRRLVLRCFLALIALQAQTNYGRINTDRVANKQAIVVTGATPSVVDGNVFKTNNSTLTTITNFTGGVNSQTITVICGDANTTIQNSSNIVTATGADIPCFINQAQVFAFDASRSKWVQKSVGAASGCSSGGEANAPHEKNGSGCAASLVPHGETTVTVGNPLSASSTATVAEQLNGNSPARFKGPNLYNDITTYGVRATKSSATTCSMTSGSAVATLAGAQTFINGIGVVCRGAGARITLSTPAAPTVTAVLLSSPPGTGGVVTDTIGGSTSYSYEVIHTDKGRGYTAASTTTRIANGRASLGPQTVNLSTWTATGNTVTMSTATAHNLVKGAMIWLAGDTNFGANAPYTVVSIVDMTHFTFTVANSTVNGLPSSGTSKGTLTYYVAVHISTPVSMGMFQAFVYGGSAGSGNLLFPMLPQSINSNLNSDVLDNTFDDLGSTYLTLPTLPDWVPSTVPGVAKNDDLATTISSGGGTRTLTLAAKAGSTVSGGTFKEDDAPTLKSCLSASTGATQICQIPAGIPVTTNSLLDMTDISGVWQLQQAATLTLNDTFLANSSAFFWTGSPIIGDNAGAPTFRFQYLPTITVDRAYPGIYSQAQFHFTNLQIKSIGVPNKVLWLDDMSGNAIPGFRMDNVGMSTGSANDCFGRHFIERSSSAGGAFQRIDNISDSVGTCSVFAMTPSWLFSNRGSSPIFTKNWFFNRRAVYFGGSALVTIDSIYVQGATTPQITVQPLQGGAIGTSLKIRTSIQDTSLTPIVSVVGDTGIVAIETSNGGAGGFPLVTGTGGIYARCSYGQAGNCGQGMDFSNDPLTSLIADGIRNTQVANGSIESRSTTTVLSPQSQLAATIAPMATPAVTLTSGGSIPINPSTSFKIAPVFPVGNGLFGLGAPSATSASVAITSGNQTISIPITPATGAVGYELWQDGFEVNCSPAAAAAKWPGNTTTLVWNGFPARCGGGQPKTASTGPSNISARGVNSPFLGVTSSSGFQTQLGSLATVNRAANFPDAAGTVLLDTSNATLTNKTFDAEGTGNALTVPTKLFFRAALCNGGTAGFAADATSDTPTVACSGSATKIGVWQAADGDAITWSYLLPSDFTGNIDAKLAFNSPDTKGTVIFNLALACVDGSGAMADDPAYNSSSAFGTVTLASPANASRTTIVTNVTKSGSTPCSAGSWMNMKLTRATDTCASRVNVKGLELTVRRAM